MSNGDDIKYFYKYRSLSGDSLQFVERLLLHDELYFARPREFDDPFDCCPVPTLKATEAERAKYLDGLYKRQKPSLSRADRRCYVSRTLKGLSRDNKLREALDSIVTETVNSAGVLSLSARSDHILLWSYYADSHRGICLRFHVSASAPFFCRAQRVLYQVDRPALNLIKDSPHAQVDKALLTKADFWCYQEEWRIVEHEAGPGVHKFPAELLDAIILGARISAEDRHKVLEWVAQRKTKLEILEAKIDNEKFRLEISTAVLKC